jgi:transcriptional regulator with XRE-family HTH domain
MWTKTTKPKERRLREYDRAMLRSAFVSLFWAVISERKQRSRYTLQKFADKLGRHKSAVSRWFSKDPPNWSVDTISDIAKALDLAIELRAADRVTGQIFTSSGILAPVQSSSSVQRIEGADATQIDQIPIHLNAHITGISEVSRLSVTVQ